MNPWAIVAMVAYGALVFSLVRRTLRALPGTVRTLMRLERENDDGRKLDAMTEAVAVRAGQAVIAIQSYQEQLLHSLRAQVTEAETRARIAERRAADTITALDAASTLVRELREEREAAREDVRALRAVLDAARELTQPRPFQPRLPASMPPAAPPALSGEAEDPERKTIEMATPTAPAGGAAPTDADDGGFGEDEQTTVADRPAALALIGRSRPIPLPDGSAKPRSPTLLPPAPGRDEVPR